MNNGKAIDNSDKQVYLTLIQQNLDRRHRESLWLKGTSGVLLATQLNLDDGLSAVQRPHWGVLVVAVIFAWLDLATVHQQGLLQIKYDSARQPGHHIDFSLGTPNTLTSDLTLDFSLRSIFFFVFHGGIIVTIAWVGNHMVPVAVCAVLFVPIAVIVRCMRRFVERLWSRRRARSVAVGVTRAAVGTGCPVADAPKGGLHLWPGGSTKRS